MGLGLLSAHISVTSHSFEARELRFCTQTPHLNRKKKKRGCGGGGEAQLQQGRLD